MPLSNTWELYPNDDRTPRAIRFGPVSASPRGDPARVARARGGDGWDMLASSLISGSSLKNGSVSGTKIAKGAIDASKLKKGAVTSDAPTGWTATGAAAGYSAATMTVYAVCIAAGA
jgi:hypothetical protein